MQSGSYLKGVSRIKIWLTRKGHKPVRFRFHLTNGALYAFWVSPDASGASRGYVAAGGPGFTGATDTVGKAGYETAGKAGDTGL